MAALLLSAVVVGFGSAALAFSTDELRALPGHLHFHAVVLLGWYVMLVLQASLPRLGRTALHRRLGPWVMALGGLCVVAGPVATLGAVGKFHRAGLTWSSDMSEFPVLGIEGMSLDAFTRLLVFGNFSSVFTLALFLIAAYRFRHLGSVHKRLVLLASIELSAPAMARISRWPGLGGEDGLFIPLALASLFASLLIYDKVRENRVLPVTWAGLAAIVVIKIIFMGFSQTEPAGAFVHSLA
jgi:hypothetical protein